MLGSDSNNGTNQATPWKTIAHVNAATIASGSQVLFLSTDVWHEQLNAVSNVTYSWYGPQRDCSISSTLVAHCTQMPIIDGADVVTGWTVQSGANYKAAYTSTAVKGFVDSLYHQTTPLALQTSIANVTSTAGSIFSDGTNVYVHLLDGSNPTGHVIEVSGSRSYGVNFGTATGLSGITIDGLEVIRQAKSGISSCNGDSTGVNTVIVRNNVLFNIGDTVGDSSCSDEGSIIEVPGFEFNPTGWQVYGNWVGESDFIDSTLSFTQAGIDLMGLTSGIIRGNKVATVHGAGIQISDGNNQNCTAPVISGNEVTNSEANIYIIGCANAYVVANNIHDSFGEGIELGGGFQSGDQNNNAPYIANNVWHDLTPAYSNGAYNGLDVNHSTNGIATGNTCYRVAAGCMTLEADSAPSSGWQIYGNTFDQSQGTGYNGTTGPSAKAYPMYVRDTSLSGGLTMRANTFVFNATTPIIRFGATSASDTTHDLSQLTFDQDYPNYEILGTPVIYSAAGTALPTCVTALKGLGLTVSDATSPTYNGTYTSGGAVTVPVVCSGSAWLTH